MAEQRFIPVARVIKTHGLKGEVSVSATDDLPFILAPGMPVWFAPPVLSGPRATEVLGVRQGPKGPLVCFAGIEDIETASHLRGRNILVEARYVPVAEEPSTYDLKGWTVQDEVRGELGIVESVIETGANDVLVVEGGPFGEVLVPVIESCVIGFDDSTRIVSVRLLPGLIEED